MNYFVYTQGNTLIFNNNSKQYEKGKSIRIAAF